MNATKIIMSMALLGAIPVTAKQTSARESARAGMEQAGPKEMDPNFIKAAPYAQQLVDEALATHPEILLMAMHVTAPDDRNVIVASNFGRIGKLGDVDDMRCTRTGKSNLEVHLKKNRFEDELTLKDEAGQTIGAFGVVFAYEAEDDKVYLSQIARQTRDEMQPQIPSGSRLFDSA